MKSKPQILPALRSQFEEYSRYHSTSGNKITHSIGIPLIVLSLLGLLARVPIAYHVNAAMVAGFLLLAVTLRWDWRIGVAFEIVLVALYFLATVIELPLLWTFFVLGWVLQFVGHGVYEKKSPAFLTNVQHLLVGPLWVFCRAIGVEK
jgi:uncharacterized membrane protein YGL010W